MGFVVRNFHYKQTDTVFGVVSQRAPQEYSRYMDRNACLGNSVVYILALYTYIYIHIYIYTFFTLYVQTIDLYTYIHPRTSSSSWVPCGWVGWEFPDDYTSSRGS